MKKDRIPLTSMIVLKLRNFQITMICVFFYIYFWPEMDEFPASAHVSSLDPVDTFYVKIPPFIVTDGSSDLHQIVFFVFWIGLGLLFFLGRPLLLRLDFLAKKIPISWQFFIFVILPVLSAEYFVRSLISRYR